MNATSYSRRHLATVHKLWEEHRTVGFLLLNTALGAITGLGFWLLLVRVAGLPPGEIGIGYAIVSLGATIALLARGGLDTALLRSVPSTGGRHGRRLMYFATGVSLAAVAVLSLGLRLAGELGAPIPALAPGGWPLVAGIAALMATVALQDAWFLAEGRAKATFSRNLAFSGARLALPLPVVALAIPLAVPVAWMLALALAVMLGLAMSRSPEARQGRPLPPRELLRSARRNIAGSAAEFLPGLVLVPLVLVITGPTAAGYFGIAWAIATMLTLASAAIGRAALADMSRSVEPAAAVRRGVRQAITVILPGTALCALLAYPMLLIFGADYAAAATPSLVVLAATSLFVAPAFLYLAVLRAQERSVALLLFPAAMITLLLILAPTLTAIWGLLGVSMAWLFSNAPFGLYATWRLRAVAGGS